MDKKFVVIICGEDKEETEKVIRRTISEHRGLLFSFSDDEMTNREINARMTAKWIVNEKVNAIVEVNSLLFFETFLLHLQKNEADIDIQYFFVDTFGEITISDSENIKQKLSEKNNNKA